MDSKGYLWILTLHGISKFDGLNFKNYVHEPNNINSLFRNDPDDFIIDNQDNIWLAFKTNLYKLNVASQIFEQIKWKNKPLEIHKLAFDSSSNCVFGANYNGYYKIQTTTLALQYDTFIIKEKRTSEGIGEIFLDSKKRLWIPYWRYGYHCINTKTHKQYMHLQNRWPLSFTQDKQGEIYANCWMEPFIKIKVKDTIHELEEYKYPMDFYYTSIVYHSALATKLTGDSIIWFNSTAKGLWLFNKNSKKYVTDIKFHSEFTDGLPEKEQNYFYEDRFGNFWICTWGGIIKVNPNEQQFQSRVIQDFDFRLYNLISGIYDDPLHKNITWISLHGAGLFKMDKKNNKVIDKYFYELTKTNNPNEDINYDRRWLKNTMVSSDKTIWCPTYGGLAKVKNTNVSFVDIRYNNRICYLHQAIEMNKNCILLASDLGALQLNPENNTHSYIPNEWNKDKTTKDYIANTVCKVNDSTAVFGTQKGLLFYNINSRKVSNKIFRIPNTDSSNLNKINSIVCHNHSIYAGTLEGLVQLNLRNNTQQLIGTNKNIDAIYTNSMLLDADQKLWIYTIHDLYCYDTKNKNIYTYTKKDGIHNLANDGNVLFEYNKKFYIGFRKSYTEFNPLLVNKSSAINEPQINEIFVNRQKLNINYDEYATNDYKLNYKQNEIKIDFTALDFTYTDKITFQVMLQGLDETWRNMGTNRTITFNNLKPGKYIFKIKSATSAGLWNEKYKSFCFYIQPAFWQTLLFKLLLALALALAIFYFVRQRINNIRAKANVKQQLTELEMQSFRSQMNPHFIFNSLHSIHNYIWDNKQEDASEYLVKFSKLIRRILELSSEKTISLSEEIETIKLYIDLEHRRTNAKFSYQINTESLDKNPKQLFVPPLIYQPYIENAIWHGLNNLPTNNGELHITFVIENNYLLCTIDDNGIGRQKAQALKNEKSVHKKSMGLEITRKRIEQFSTKILNPIEIIDKTIGTKIIIKLPLIYE
jgi:sensor histidine kinase YesM